jgi:hypothetical protein
MVEMLVGLRPDGDRLRFTPMTEAPRIVLRDLRVGGWRGDLDTRSAPAKRRARRSP